jgi:hypothetical protein
MYGEARIKPKKVGAIHETALFIVNRVDFENATLTSNAKLVMVRKTIALNI